MWIVQYKPNNDSQPWHTLEAYDNKPHAIMHASRVSDQYFLVKVIDPEGYIIWRK